MRHRKGWFCLILLALGVSSASACSNQGEGQRCDKNSGDSDCASGLVCTTLPALSVPGSLPQSVCCPPQNQSATTAVCSSVSTQFVVDAGVDAGSTGGEGGTSGASGAAGTGGAAGSGGSKQSDAAAGGTSTLDASTADASIDGSP